MKVLHIISSPRKEDSNSLHIANKFIEALAEQHADLVVEELDLFETDLPAAAGATIESKYLLMQGQALDSSHLAEWRRIEELIQHFLSADLYLVSSPMWNFSISYPLKYYIDCIVQPGYLFKYNEQGQPVGLVTGKKMVCVCSKGADYGPDSPFSAYDFQEPYLRAIFGFIGITDMQFLSIQPTDYSPDIRTAALEAGLENAVKLAKGLLAA